MRDRQFLHEKLFRGDAFELLSNKTVTMAGVGSLGSNTSLNLDKSGIDRFILIDHDSVELHNTTTQAFTLEQIRQKKVQAISQTLYRLSKCRSKTYPVMIDSRNVDLCFVDADLTICTFDNQASRLIVRDRAVELDVPCLFGGMSGKFQYGEAIWAEWYNPPEDPIANEVDPCYYPLSVSLTTFISSLITEIALQYLLYNKKLVCRKSIPELLEKR